MGRAGQIEIAAAPVLADLLHAKTRIGEGKVRTFPGRLGAHGAAAPGRVLGVEGAGHDPLHAAGLIRAQSQQGDEPGRVASPEFDQTGAVARPIPSCPSVGRRRREVAPALGLPRRRPADHAGDALPIALLACAPPVLAMKTQRGLGGHQWPLRMVTVVCRSVAATQPLGQQQVLRVELELRRAGARHRRRQHPLEREQLLEDLAARPVAPLGFPLDGNGFDESVGEPAPVAAPPRVLHGAELVPEKRNAVLLLAPTLALGGERIGARVFGGGVREQDHVASLGPKAPRVRQQEGHRSRRPASREADDVRQLLVPRVAIVDLHRVSSPEATGASPRTVEAPGFSVAGSDFWGGGGRSRRRRFRRSFPPATLGCHQGRDDIPQQTTGRCFDH